MAEATRCPSCGAPVEFKTTVSLYTVCAHCRSLVYRKGMDLEALGKVAELQKDGSPLQLAAVGGYKGAGFTVVGRIQLRYEQGFWNEWHLRFDDEKSGWLGEAQGLYAVSFQFQTSEPIPEGDAVAVGKRLDLAGKTYTVKDLREAEYVSGEGELPFRVPFGEKGDFADLAEAGGGFATIDYSEDPPLLFAGEYVPFETLKLRGLKVFEGW